AVQRSRPFEREECTQRARRDAPPPARRRDPVRDFPPALDREAADRPDELSVVLDREQRVRGVAADPLVVRVERAAVGWIRPCERSHPDCARVALPLEKRVEIGVRQGAQSDRHQHNPSIGFTAYIETSVVPLTHGPALPLRGRHLARARLDRDGAAEYEGRYPYADR